MPQGPNFIVTFLYYFATTTLIVLLLASQGMGMSLESRFLYQLGTLCGLVAGILGAYFNRSATISITFQNPKAFRKQLDTALAQMGFDRQTQLDNFVVYGKSALKTMFAGKILVKIDENSATIIGRSSNLKQLKQLI
ncbi:MAG: hypothetical protein IGR93_01630 [Hydrococcus sp. C42_A2020_068]|uniref:hypothetical protein n=1 Tax=Pleurocapsa sp. PCC 7327 TaxID=118163 RepID=UPI00029FE294|nr:hypothetical protein [Pleurocapsa sp. PCC 7327]AFY76366.1 hypothetical protein Ple7327_0943 [Pleurocapsa sp. PCC 7327]MBF2018829.1 hypothetical protein [Hydrococcus sp. C42_A2020_068]